MSEMTFRLRRYAPDGTPGKYIKFSTMSASFVASDAYAITSCAISAKAYKDLAFPMLVGLEYAAGTSRGRVPGGLIFLTSDGHDAVDAAKVSTVSGIQWVPRQLAGAKVYQSAEAEATEGNSGQRGFSGAPGKIMRTLVTEAQARGWFPSLVIDFTNTLDSSGAAWAQSMASFSLQVGSSVWDVLTKLVKAGVCEFTVEFSGGVHTLRLWNAPHGVDRTVSPLVRISRTSEATAVPIKQDFANVATVLVGLLDDGTAVERPVAGAPTEYGRIEAWVQLKGVLDTTTAEMLLDNLASQANAPKRQTAFTRNASDRVPLPIRDYWVGDSTQFMGDAGWESGRVTQVVITADQNGVTTVQDSFGSFFPDTLTKLASLTAGATGGIISGGGSGSPGSSPGYPSVPTGITVTPSSYWDESGILRGKVSIAWDRVVTTTAGAPVTISQYEVWVNNLTTADQDQVLILGDSAFPVASANDLSVTDQYSIEVMARTPDGLRSDPSTPWIGTVGLPSNTLTPPSNPTVTSAVGSFTVSLPAWTMATTPASAVPSQIVRMAVYLATVSNGSDAVQIGNLFSASDAVTTVQAGLPAGARRYFAITAVDSLGRETAASAWVPFDLAETLLGGVSLGTILLETTSEPNRGLKIGSSDLVVYNAGGGVSFQIDAETGAVAGVSITLSEALVGVVKSPDGTSQIDLSDNNTIQFSVKPNATVVYGQDGALTVSDTAAPGNPSVRVAPGGVQVRQGGVPVVTVDATGIVAPGGTLAGDASGRSVQIGNHRFTNVVLGATKHTTITGV